MQLSSLIYIISRQIPKQKSAKFPNKNTPSSQTELCQTAEQIITKLRNKISPNCGKVSIIFAHVSYFYYLCSVFQKITNYGRL